MDSTNRSFAIVTGASSGIGYELARCCAEHGFDLLIAADSPEIHGAAEELRQLGCSVQTVEVDLATEEGVDQDLLFDSPEIHGAAEELRQLGCSVQTVEVDLATEEGVDRLYAAAQGRAVDALLANAGHGLGHAFLDQDFHEVRHVIDTNITGTIYLIQKVGREMRARARGRILITGSIAGFISGSVFSVCTL